MTRGPAGTTGFANGARLPITHPSGRVSPGYGYGYGYGAPLYDYAAPAYGYAATAPLYNYAAPAYAAPAAAGTTVIIVTPAPAYAAPPVRTGYYSAPVVSQPIYNYASGMGTATHPGIGTEAIGAAGGMGGVKHLTRR